MEHCASFPAATGKQSHILVNFGSNVGTTMPVGPISKSADCERSYGAMCGGSVHCPSFVTFDFWITSKGHLVMWERLEMESADYVISSKREVGCSSAPHLTTRRESAFEQPQNNRQRPT